MDVLLSIMFDEAYLMNRTNHWFYHIKKFNKEHIIQPYNVNILKTPEYKWFISCMAQLD